MILNDVTSMTLDPKSRHNYVYGVSRRIREGQTIGDPKAQFTGWCGSRPDQKMPKKAKDFGVASQAAGRSKVCASAAPATAS